MSSRLQELRTELVNLDADALWIADPLNRRYVSGFCGSSGHLVVSQAGACLLTDFRYYERSAQEAPEFELVKQEQEFPALLADLTRSQSIHKLGFEEEYVNYKLFSSVQAALGDECSLVPMSGVVEKLRAVKSAEEVGCIRRAVEITDGAYERLREVLRPGMTERHVAWELESYMRTNGAESLAFSIIVAAGPNGAMPHAVASDRPIGLGEAVVVDMGARVNGYCADMTRTVCLGEPDEQFCRVYNVVLQAQLRAEGVLRAGMPGREADAVARGIIEEAGFGSCFGHSLGHGVGLNIHERPRLSKANEDPLPAGAVVTVEPGIYLSGWGGVRTEDTVVLTDSGIEVLTQSPKGLAQAILDVK